MKRLREIKRELNEMHDGMQDDRMDQILAFFKAANAGTTQLEKAGEMLDDLAMEDRRFMSVARKFSDVISLVDDIIDKVDDVNVD
jgi:gamma-glutamyl phosphate reductase